ncbi:hypothetical protein GPROT2_03762 [Gammaproteobacteria bacterium]|nr:hypothetical protein GPROT2_03762 [Gammaproteobacteria bacterium]
MRRMKRFLRRLPSYALAILTAAGAPALAADAVAVVIGEEGAAHAEVAARIRSRLEPAVKVSLHRTADVAPGPGEARLLVAVGAKAAARLAIARDNTPLLVTLLPQEAFERLAADSRSRGSTRPLSAVYLDQPVGRQLDLLRLAVPKARRIGVLLGTEAGSGFNALSAAAIERALDLKVRRIARPDELAAELQALLPETDLLLAVPDASVFNAGTIQMILLSAYRRQQPLVGFSAAYTRAGALVSLHSTPAQIGEQAADMIDAALARGALPPPQHPRQFVVTTNPHVAHSLGIPIESEDALLRRLQAIEAR